MNALVEEKIFCDAVKKISLEKMKMRDREFSSTFLKNTFEVFLYFRSSLKVIFDVQIEINPETNFIDDFPEFVSFCKFVYFLSLASYSGFI